MKIIWGGALVGVAGWIRPALFGAGMIGCDRLSWSDESWPTALAESGGG